MECLPSPGIGLPRVRAQVGLAAFLANQAVSAVNQVVSAVNRAVSLEFLAVPQGSQRCHKIPAGSQASLGVILVASRGFRGVPLARDPVASVVRSFVTPAPSVGER